MTRQHRVFPTPAEAADPTQVYSDHALMLLTVPGTDAVPGVNILSLNTLTQQVTADEEEAKAARSPSTSNDL